MKTLILKFISALALLAAIVHSANAQELAKIPSNFDVSAWARPTTFPAYFNYPRDFGMLPGPCSFSHLKFDDPINRPGQPSTAPLHVFFGNTQTNASSTYQSLRTSGEGTCFGGPLNRSAFFMPSVMNAQGKVVLPDLLDVQYKGGPGTMPFPRGLKMIFGYDEVNPTAPWDINMPPFAWSYSDSGGYWPPIMYNATMRFRTLQPNSLPTWAWSDTTTFGYRYPMSARVISPSCWDGVNLDSQNHRTHMAYKVNGACPPSHPRVIPEVIITAYYKNLGRADVQGWYLSSDRFMGKNLPAGTNLYAGMIPAWDDDVMASWVVNILNARKYGSFGKIGDGRILEKPPTSKVFAPTANLKPYFLWSLRTQAGSKGASTTSNNNIVDPPAR